MTSINLPPSLPGAGDPASPNYNGYLRNVAKNYLSTARFYARWDRNSRMRGFPDKGETIERADYARMAARLSMRMHLCLGLDGIKPGIEP